MITGHDTHEMAGFVAPKYQGFEDLFDVFAQSFGHVSGRQVVFVDGVRDKSVGDVRLVQATGRVGFRDFLFHFCVWTPGNGALIRDDVSGKRMRFSNGLSAARRIVRF